MQNFECRECGRKFRSTRAAAMAMDKGCPGCGGSDIDLRSFEAKCEDDPKFLTTTPMSKSMQKRLRFGLGGN